MIAVRPGHDGTAGHWRLISRTTGGADVLATAPLRRAAGGPGWQQVVERLRDGDGTLVVRLESDGHYRWVLADANGEVIAQSPAVYRDGDSCRRAFSFARRAARAVVGGTLTPPMAR
jgi:uncharacterized protein YegP (UPF0339 family)